GVRLKLAPGILRSGSRSSLVVRVQTKQQPRLFVESVTRTLQHIDARGHRRELSDQEGAARRVLPTGDALRLQRIRKPRGGGADLRERRSLGPYLGLPCGRAVVAAARIRLAPAARQSTPAVGPGAGI